MKQLLGLCLFVFFLTPSVYAAVDINTATQSELESLSGIGPSKAQAIIDYRKKNGGYKSLDELEQVQGIGPATLSNLKKDITLGVKTGKAPEPLKMDTTKKK
ncbi:ComEA family DNA-binding protein [Methylophilus aquaticus]|uniref:Helix-hairpin-helix domain-containing protein n=1 Tax=Methylophilus aquaticus TaxID=1971610 RepID=A0ABT9JR16_9PROT|nr:helix-hairpin-helix domain-containing protein [Methylophilus aquaticus]MDP8567004.1 helix-hairpin-helix domain-containing protein [Methylophilus aquaticus]